MFKHFEEFSPTLNKGIILFMERLDMDKRNRELFCDLLGFVYDEGKIAGKEEFLKDQQLKQINEDGDSDKE